jgi:uncharacterized protein (TIGR02599 family)
MPNPPFPPQEKRGFTLVELLVSTAILSLLCLVLVSITNSTGATWRYSSGKIEEFREAQLAFDAITTRLSQATLNTYYDYFDNSTQPQQRTAANAATFVPTRYGRASELRFLSGPVNDGSPAALGNFSPAVRMTHGVFFQAPFGLVDSTQTAAPGTNYHGFDNALNAWGYFVEFRDDSTSRPPILGAASPPPRYRYRLMEFRQPAQAFQIYKDISTNAGPYNWFQQNVNATGAPVHILAENIIALIVHPQLAKEDIDALTQQGQASELTPDYRYDSTRSNPVPALNSKNQLPPVLQIFMVAIDEASASRLNLSASSGDLFQTAGKFVNTANLHSDLYYQDPNAAGVLNPGSLEKSLIDRHLNYRIFTTSVSIRSAKWSRTQNF